MRRQLVFGRKRVLTGQKFLEDGSALVRLGELQG
jgi:hypothetical protein